MSKRSNSVTAHITFFVGSGPQGEEVGMDVQHLVWPCAVMSHVGAQAHQDLGQSILVII